MSRNGTYSNTRVQHNYKYVQKELMVERTLLEQLCVLLCKYNIFTNPVPCFLSLNSHVFEALPQGPTPLLFPNNFTVVTCWHQCTTDTKAPQQYSHTLYIVFLLPLKYTWMLSGLAPADWGHPTLGGTFRCAAKQVSIGHCHLYQHPCYDIGSMGLSTPAGLCFHRLMSNNPN